MTIDLTLQFHHHPTHLDLVLDFQNLGAGATIPLPGGRDAVIVTTPEDELTPGERIAIFGTAYGPGGEQEGAPRVEKDEPWIPEKNTPTDAALQAAGRGLLEIGKTIAGLADDVWNGLDDAARQTWPISLAAGGTDISLNAWLTLFGEDNPITAQIVKSVNENYGAIVVAGGLIKSGGLLVKIPTTLAGLAKLAGQTDLIPTIDDITDYEFTEEQKELFDEAEEAAQELTQRWNELDDRVKYNMMFSYMPWLDKKKGATDEMDTD